MGRLLLPRLLLPRVLLLLVLLAGSARGADVRRNGAAAQLRGQCIKHGSDKAECCAANGCAFPATGACISKKSNGGVDTCMAAPDTGSDGQDDVTRCAAHSGKDQREDCCKTKGCGAANPGCLAIGTFDRDKKLTNLCGIDLAAAASAGPRGDAAASLPPCPPPNAPCAFPKFWEMIWNDHCRTYPVEPGAIEKICAWIKLECKHQGGHTEDPDDPHVPDVVEPCEASTLCTAQGRETLLVQPCDCGECFSIPSRACPDDPRSNDLLMVVSGESSGSCSCGCKTELEACSAPQERLEASCLCECPASSAAERERCKRDGVALNLVWNDAACTCACNPSITSSLGPNQVMDPNTCAVTCTPNFVAECKNQNKLATPTCDACGACASDLPECTAPQTRGEDCKCACPGTAVAACAARGGVLDAATCQCTCANACDNSLQTHSPDACAVCECKPEAEAACPNPVLSLFDTTTCTYGCDTTKSCPGAQANVPATEGDTCACACACSGDKTCTTTGQVYDESLCACVFPDCPANMARNDQTGKCECDASKKAQLCVGGQVLLPGDDAGQEGCICGCPPELDAALKSKKKPEDWQIDVSMCTIGCQSATTCQAAEEGTMERSVEKECACACSSAAQTACAARGGDIDETCACETCTPMDAASKHEYVQGASVKTGCQKQCKADPACSGPGASQDPNTCDCVCSAESIQACTSKNKGVPNPPTCSSCGACINPPVCGSSETLGADCSCACKSAEALMCPDPSVAVTKNAQGQCACGCPAAVEPFLHILDPSTSCDAVCNLEVVTSCGGLLTGTVTMGSKENKCECACDATKCEGKPQSKPVWVNEADKTLGCKCSCPTPPQDCAAPLVWSAGECGCSCPAGSCLCGEGKRNQEKFCQNKGMAYHADATTGQCSCVCSDEGKKQCKASFGDMVTSKLNRGASGCQCGCDLSMAEQTKCPEGQIRRDVRGCPRGFSGDSVQDSNCDQTQACQCSCSAGALEKLVGLGRAASNAVLDPSDPSCATAVCPASEAEKFKAYLSPTHPNLVFDQTPHTCNLVCKAQCSKGKQLNDWCDCVCPATAPKCSANKFLSSDCKQCMCRDECPYPGMIQDPRSCQCMCATKPTCKPWHDTVLIDGHGCACQCKNAGPGVCGANQILDKDSCACVCDPRLPRKDGDFVLKEVATRTGSVRTQCDYVCDATSPKAAQCARSRVETFELAPDGRSCNCQCARQQCGDVRLEFIDWRNHARLETVALVTGRDSAGQCGCVCPAERLGVPCANPSQKRSERDCQCQCENADAEERKCRSRGMFFNPATCSCACGGCPGDQELRDPKLCDSCHCPLSTLASSVASLGRRAIDFALSNHHQYSSHGRHCTWQCSAESTAQCTRRGEVQRGFPDCGCEAPYVMRQEVASPPREAPKKKVASKCKGKWTCEGARRGSKKCRTRKQTQWYICPAVARGCMGVCVCLEPGLTGSSIPATGYQHQHCRAVNEDLSRYVFS
jgi:hypothetical protein